MSGESPGGPLARDGANVGAEENTAESLRGSVELPNANDSLGLASRARGGDREALGALLALHEGWLRRIARIELGARMRRHVDSLDLVQEVGMTAFQEIGDLRLTSASSVRGWLRTILKNHVRGMVARLTAEKRDIRRDVPMRPSRPAEETVAGAFDPEAHETLPDERAVKLEMSELLDEVVSELPDDQRTVVLLRDFDHASWDEIQVELDRPTVGAVQQLHQRAWVRILDKASRRLQA